MAARGVHNVFRRCMFLCCTLRYFEASFPASRKPHPLNLGNAVIVVIMEKSGYNRNSDEKILLEATGVTDAVGQNIERQRMHI